VAHLAILFWGGDLWFPKSPHASSVRHMRFPAPRGGSLRSLTPGYPPSAPEGRTAQKDDLNKSGVPRKGAGSQPEVRSESI